MINMHFKTDRVYGEIDIHGAKDKCYAQMLRRILNAHGLPVIFQKGFRYRLDPVKYRDDYIQNLFMTSTKEYRVGALSRIRAVEKVIKIHKGFVVPLDAMRLRLKWINKLMSRDPSAGGDQVRDILNEHDPGLT